MTKEISEKIRNLCRGCRLYEDPNLVCPLFIDTTDSDNEKFLNILSCCPCRDCLIKSMCNSACSKFNMYIQFTSYEIEKSEENYYERWVEGV